MDSTIVVNYRTIIIVFLVIINLVSLLFMFLDKEKAKQGKRRISEKTLFFLALIFGGIGIYAGMFFFRHKTKKWYFVIFIPLLIMLNWYLFFQLFNYLKG